MELIATSDLLTIKPVIYAAWNWNETVEDALHQAGFATFEEQAAALAEQRKKLA